MAGLLDKLRDPEARTGTGAGNLEDIGGKKGEWKDKAKTQYVPKKGVTIPQRASNRNIDDKTGKPRYK